MLAERKDLVLEQLRKAQAAFETQGFICLISQSALPNGFSFSLVVGETEEAIVAQYTAEKIGSEAAFTKDGQPRFAYELAEHIADRAIAFAAQPKSKGN